MVSLVAAATDAYLEARWLMERLSGGEGLISGTGRNGLTIYYARLGRGGWRRNLLMAKAETKREVAANSEEIK